MPSKCSVPGCKGNYDNERKVSVYGFPRDERLKNRWVVAIRRKDFTVTKYSCVCERHFKNDDFEYEVSAYDPRTGVTITAPLARKRLKKGVIPSLFLPIGVTVPLDDKTSLKNQKNLKYVSDENFDSNATSELISSSPVSRLATHRKEKEKQEMAKRKRKATVESSNKKLSSKNLKENGSSTSNGLEKSDSDKEDSNLPEKSASINPKLIPLADIQIKQEPLSDEEIPSGTSSNKPGESISENVQITNVRSLSNENLAAAEEENGTKKLNEVFDKDFYSKPLDIDRREKAFSGYVACELSDLRENPALYMKAKQSILKILADAHLEMMRSSKKS